MPLAHCLKISKNNHAITSVTTCTRSLRHLSLECQRRPDPSWMLGQRQTHLLSCSTSHLCPIWGWLYSVCFCRCLSADRFKTGSLWTGCQQEPSTGGVLSHNVNAHRTLHYLHRTGWALLHFCKHWLSRHRLLPAGQSRGGKVPTILGFYNVASLLHPVPPNLVRKFDGWTGCN